MVNLEFCFDTLHRRQNIIKIVVLFEEKALFTLQVIDSKLNCINLFFVVIEKTLNFVDSIDDDFFVVLSDRNFAHNNAKLEKNEKILKLCWNI